MAVTQNKIVTSQALRNESVQFTNTNGTVEVDLFVAGTNGSIVRGIFCSTDNGVSFVLSIKNHNGTSALGLVNETVPALSGLDPAGLVPMVSVMTSLRWAPLPVDENGNKVWPLEAGQKLTAVCSTNMASGRVANVFAIGDDL